MEKKETSRRYSPFRTFFNRIYSIYSFFGRKGYNAFSKTAFLNNQKGFTLIEIITTLGIITILATIVLTAVNPIEQFQKAQDAKRKSDLAQLQRVLEAYYQDHGRYPSHTTSGIDTYTMNKKDGESNEAVAWGTSWPPYIDVVPIDPNSSKYYIYISDPSNGYQSYRLYASLDRGREDPDACSGETGCPNVPADVECGGDSGIYYCDYGVTSPNISP